MIFDDLFVLEMANNHLGSVDRGLKIIEEFSKVVRYNDVKAAIKLQIRDVDRFIHKDHKNDDNRYIKKTITTKLSINGFQIMVNMIHDRGCIPMATAFDEESVNICEDLGIPIYKIASSDVNDWFLLEAVAKTRKPVIVSTGGTSLKDIDDMVLFFENRNIPLAINHCIALYPTEDCEMELNQIDFLKNRYPNHVIGLSSHEHEDWQASMYIAYAKGARTFERHIDVDNPSSYCSLPGQIDAWFKAYKKAVSMCGSPGSQKRIPPDRELKYLDELVRGVYAVEDIEKGEYLTNDDIYLAIPLINGQLSCRDVMNGMKLKSDVAKDAPIMKKQV